MAHIVCYRSGETFVSRRVPKGTMKIVTGHGRRLKRILSVCARHAYDGNTLLVPGLPEAENDLQAISAVKGFEEMLRVRLAKGPHRRTKGAQAAMSYDYIRNYYGIEITVNRLVRHTVTARYGKIKPEGRSHQHYVKVHFHGDDHYSNCHPRELEFVAHDE